jgi:general stress protein 26
MTSAQSSVSRVWDIIETSGIAMLTTKSAVGLRARPLEPRPDRSEACIWFLTDKSSGKIEEIAKDCNVVAAFVNETANIFLSVTGRAYITYDMAKTSAIWRKTDTMWWRGGPQDPGVRLLRLEPLVAELWDGPSSKALALFEYAKARLTGAKPDLGENRKTTVHMR